MYPGHILRAEKSRTAAEDRIEHGARSPRVFPLVALIVVLGVACSGGGEEPSIRGCPQPNWEGPWTACAEARWVARVVEAGGYSAGVGEGVDTGSALIAEGHGRVFYVSAANTGAVERSPHDDGVRISWSAQGFTFWVQAVLYGVPGYERPTVDELEPVVAASRRLRPPPASE